MVILIESNQKVNPIHYFKEIVDGVFTETIHNQQFLYHLTINNRDDYICNIIDRIREGIQQEVIKKSYLSHSDLNISFLSNFTAGLYISSFYLKLCSNYFKWEAIGVMTDPAGNQSVNKLETKKDDDQLIRKQFVDIINTHWQASETQILNIYGVSGIGKTTILKQLTFFEEQNYIQIHSSGKTLSNYTWYSDYIDLRDAKENITTHRVTDLIVDYFKDKTSRLIIIDNIHWLNQFDMTVIDQLAKKRIKILTTSWYPISTLMHWDTAWIKEVEILAFSKEDIELLAAKSTHLVNEKAQETIYELTEGHPLLAQHFIKYSSSLSRENKLPTTLVDSHKTLAKDLSSSYFENGQTNDYSLEFTQLLASLPQALDSKTLLQFCSVHHELSNVIQKILQFPFIDEDPNTHAVTFQHEFYRQAVQLIPGPPLPSILLKSLAEHLERNSYQYSAATIYRKINLLPEQFNNLLTTAKIALEEKNYLHLLDVVNTTLPVAEKCALDDDKLAQLHWIAGAAHDKVGVLEDVVYHHEKFLKSIHISRKPRFHLLLFHWLFAYHKQKFSPSLKHSSFSPDQIAHVLRTLAEYYSFADHGDKIVLETMYLYHIVHKNCSSNFDYLGECDMFIAIVIQPLFGKNLATKWTEHGRYLAKKSNNQRAILYSEILYFNIQQYTPNWHSNKLELNHLKLAEEAKDQKLYSLAMRSFLIYVVYGLDKYDGHHVYNFHKKAVVPLLKYVPEWMQLWSSVASLLISTEIDHPARTLFYSQKTYPKEVRSATLLCFAAAEMALGNSQKCKKWFDLFYEYKHQLQYINTTFSVIIKPLFEVAIYLYIKNNITKKQFKFIQKISKKHANLCYKSKPLFIGYQAIYKVIKDDSRKALQDLSKATKMAKDRYNTPAQKLFELYHSIFKEGTIPKSKFIGRDMRIEALYSIYQ